MLSALSANHQATAHLQKTNKNIPPHTRSLQANLIYQFDVEDVLEDGAYAQFHVEAFSPMVGREWDASTGAKPNISVFRAKNLRSQTEGGFLAFPRDGSIVHIHGYGCWNPEAFRAASDFLTGDIIELPDLSILTYLADKVYAEYMLETYDLLQALRIPVASYTALASTGWNIPAENIQFGKSGVVGGWWGALQIEYEFEASTEVHGNMSDSVGLPYTVEYFDDASGIWVAFQNGNQVLDDLSEKQHNGEFYGTVCFDSAVTTSKIRINWESTDLHQSQGLSTYRSGGGFHAEPLTFA